MSNPKVIVLARVRKFVLQWSFLDTVHTHTETKAHARIQIQTNIGPKPFILYHFSNEKNVNLNERWNFFLSILAADCYIFRYSTKTWWKKGERTKNNNKNANTYQQKCFELEIISACSIIYSCLQIQWLCESKKNMYICITLFIWCAEWKAREIDTQIDRDKQRERHTAWGVSSLLFVRLLMVVFVCSGICKTT